MHCLSNSIVTVFMAAVWGYAQAEPIRILVGGDTMMSARHDMPVSRAMKDALSRFIKPLAQSKDLVLFNLEGPLDDGTMPAKICGSDHCFSFGQPLETVNLLKDAGITAVSINNNHAFDRGEQGRQFTLNALLNKGIAPVHERATTLNYGTYDIAMLSYSANTGSFDIRKLKPITEYIRSIKQDRRIIVVAVHAGAEGEQAVKIPCTSEMYLGEDRGNVAYIGHTLVDAGADVIIMHGPHVPRPLEIYKNKMIAYSMGNGFVAQGISIAGVAGKAAYLDFAISEKGDYLQHKVHWFQQNRAVGLIPIADPGLMPMLSSVCATSY